MGFVPIGLYVLWCTTGSHGGYSAEQAKHKTHVVAGSCGIAVTKFKNTRHGRIIRLKTTGGLFMSDLRMEPKTEGQVPRLLEVIKELAQKDLTGCVAEGASMMPKGIIIKDNKIAGVVGLFLDKEQKSTAYRCFGSLCGKNCSDACTFISDGYMRKMTKEEAENFDPSQSLADLPEDMRSECLTISYIDFKNLKNNIALIMPYERKGRVLSFGEDSEESHDNGGQIVSCILAGFVRDRLAKLFKDTFKNPNEISLERAKELHLTFLSTYLRGIEDMADLKHAIATEIVSGMCDDYGAFHGDLPT